MHATLSIMGLYNYDPAVFDGFKPPAGLDRDVLIQEICMQAAELELVYPSYDFMKTAIRNWNVMELPIWQKMYDSTKFQYNPLWNVDAYETLTRTGERTFTNEQSNKDKNTATDYTNAYNSGTWTQSDKTENVVEYGKKEESTERPNLTDTTRRYGNIGVTKATDLIDSYRDTEQFNIYQYIIDSFIRRFCLLVY